jgi:hypothetical protein
MKNLPAIRDLDARVARILHQHAIIAGAAAQMAVTAALAGLELKALKKECGHGNWEEFFARHIERHGLKLRTAQNYMALADGLKGKALKNATDSFLLLLEKAPSDLKKADQEKLTKAVAKVADGATLSELYQDLGIVKKPQGSGAKGGNTRGKESGGSATETNSVGAEGGKDNDSDDVDAAATLAGDQTKRLTNLIDEALRDRPFNAATKAERTKLHGLLVDLTAAVKETLK